MRPHHNAVAVSPGCEILHKCVTGFAELHPDMVASALDVTNASNSIQRQHCLEAVRRLRAEPAPFVQRWYNRGSTYVHCDLEGALHEVALDEKLYHVKPEKMCFGTSCRFRISIFSESHALQTRRSSLTSMQ